MLWIGTSNGLSVMDTKTQNFRTFGWEVMLQGHQCTAFSEQKQGNILIGSNAGLYVFDRIKKTIEPFPGAEELNDKLIYGIVTDIEGDIWVSTSIGIWQYSMKSKAWIGHLHGNGLSTKEYVLGAVMQAPDGTIGFGTNDGITTFQPQTVRNSRIEMGDVYLTNFLIGNETVCPLANEFTVPYGENSFTLEFSLLNYKNTENIFYQYRLNGSNWTAMMEGNNSISFNRMKPGKYVVEVRAMSNGIYSADTCTVTVVVKAPWYASTLAYFAYTLLAWALAFSSLLSRPEAAQSRPRRTEDALPHQCHPRHTLAAHPHHGAAEETEGTHHRQGESQRHRDHRPQCPAVAVAGEPNTRRA